MVQVNFRTSDFRRQVADAQALMLKNRYFEANPFLDTDDDSNQPGPSLIARPGLRRFVEVGAGPIRGLFSVAGAFNGDLFAASYDSLYRIDRLKAVTFIGSGLFDPDKGVVNMAITGNIGETPEYLFVADGRNLYVYIENGYALGSLTGIPANGNTIRVGDMYYSFTTGSVDAGSPDGTSGNPWLVALGGSGPESIQNLGDALNNTGFIGTQYSTDLESNPLIKVTGISDDTISVRATQVGIGGDGVVTTETGGALAWSSGTLTGGGDPSFSTVAMPDDVGVIDVAVVNSFVIVVPAQGEGINGRFYWIEPGETTVDPLNFATAERSPDGIYGVEIVGDQFWLPGEATTEVWYVSDDPVNRMQRLQGVVLDRGTWQNTPCAIKESLMIVDSNGGVFQINGNSPKRVSTPDIEEQIREAISLQASQP